jgi:signal transduction histidine kinase
MTRIRSRLLLLIATAAIAPLVAYGFVSIGLLRTGTEQSVVSGAQAVAARAAEQIDRYFRQNLDLLEALAAHLQHTALAPWQQERILRNFVLKFPEFSELTLFDRTGTPIVSSRLSSTGLALTQLVQDDRPHVAPVEIDADLLPRTVVTLRVDPAGSGPTYLVGELRLEELWRLVDRIRIGERGFALLVDRTGLLLAHGNADEKPRVAHRERLAAHPLVGETTDAATRRWAEYVGPGGGQLLAVMEPLPLLGWRVIIEQPTSEAFALATRLERVLMLTIGLALFATAGIAWLWSRWFLRPIGALMRGTRALSEGRLRERVQIAGRDEFAELGSAFNRMADRLVSLQADAVKQERQATFGRIAAGLVHDLAHPIQNIGNNCKLILKMHDDGEYRETFRRMVEREFSAIRRLLEDLSNLGRPIALERFPVDVNRSLHEAAERMALVAEQAGVTLEVKTCNEPLTIIGDLFALGRVYRNLLLNAVQATAPGGCIVLESQAVNGRARVRVSDTGCGIAPDRLETIFEDYSTTKRRGLGLGLAISKKIVEQLGGSIRVESEVGRGASFTLEFAAMEGGRASSDPQPAPSSASIEDASA